MKINNVIIGEGIPKICVPIVGINVLDCVKQANNIKGSKSYNRIDIIEFRGDYLIDVKKDLSEALTRVKEIIGNKILLFTYRSAFEGGQKAIEEEMAIQSIVDLDKMAIDSNLIDIIDVELFLGNNYVTEVVEYAHKNNIRVIMSNHDFNQTPSKEEIVQRLSNMDKLNGDIVKLAVMPNSKEDVAILLAATTVASDIIKKPVVTMSMGKMGGISRFVGEYFGSAITFGTVEKVSAPGQISIDQLVQLLDTINILL